MEIWKDIDGFEGLYQVSTLGRVKSLPKYTYSRGYPQLRKEKILKPGYTGKNRCYATVRLNDGRGYKVHRLVAQAFIPNPNNLPQVNHKDENPFNNAVDNLEWCTNQYNIKYSAKPLSEEHKKKIGDANRGKKRTVEQRQAMSDRTKCRYEDIKEHIKTSDAVREWWRLRKIEQCKSWKTI
jgi:hypothetical protein